MTQLSEHFTLEEFVHSDTAIACGIDNTPPADVQANLELLAGVMEEVRHLLKDNPVTISSGYRCPSLNQEIGGASNSDHLYGRACDFICASFGTPLEICKLLQSHLEVLHIQQLIHEMDSWVHLAIAPIDAAPAMQCLTINNQGTTTGFA